MELEPHSRRLPSAPSPPLSRPSAEPFCCPARCLRLCFLVVCLFVSSCSAQRDPVNNFCRRFGHQTTVIDRKLYIDGGLVNWNPLQTYPANYSNTWLLWQDLDHDASSGMPQLYANLSKNSSVPDVSGGFLWGDDVNKIFYLFGGEYYQESPPSSSFVLYAYDVLNDFWVSRGSPQQASISAVSYGAGVTVSERGEGYYYGGWLSNNSVSGWSGSAMATTGLVKYDMVGNSWTNITGPDSTARAEGVLSFIPAGDGGLLIYFGGITDPYHNGTVAGQSLDTIFVYDVLSSKWYTQTASGDVPADRRRFCAGATWTSDRSSYNIYLYGGAGMPPNASGYDDMFVLSLPSFTWTKLYPTDGNYTGEYPHHSMTCNVISGAQMLIIGGTFPLTEDCDVAQQWGTHNADLTMADTTDKALWNLFDPAETAYSVPDPVVSAIGGDASGGATMTAPSGGWDYTDLPILMTRTATIASRTPTRDVTTATSTSTGTASASLGGGAIAGIAIGAVAGLAVLAGCWWMVLRRRNYLRQQRLSSSQPSQASPGSGLHASPLQPYSPGGGGGGGPSMMTAQNHSGVYGGQSPGGIPWSHGVTGAGGYSPASPYAVTPGEYGRPLEAPTQAPAELAGSGQGAYAFGGGGAPSPAGARSVAYSTTGTGTGSGAGSGTGTGNSETLEMVVQGSLAKMDDQGRLWSPQDSNAPARTSAQRTPTSAAFSDVGSRQSSRRSQAAELETERTPPLPQQQQQQQQAPFSFSNRVHNTFYHP